MRNSWNQASTVGRLMAGFFFLLGPIMLLSAQHTTILLSVAALVILAAAWRLDRPLLRRVGERLRDGRALLILLALIGALAMISAAWSVNPELALQRGPRVLIFFALGAVLAALAGALGERERPLQRLAFATGFALMLAGMAWQAASDYQLLAWIYAFKERAGYGAFANFAACLAALGVWPLVGWLWRRGRKAWAAVLPIVVLALLTQMESASAILGLSVAIPVAIIGVFARRALGALLAMVCLVAILLPAAAGHMTSGDKAYEAESLPISFRLRMVILEVTLERIEQRPLAGWGFQSSYDLLELPERARVIDPVEKASHPHNATLHIMLELGALGLAIYIPLLFVLAAHAKRAPPPGNWSGSAMLTAALAMTATAYGIWDFHWLTLLMSAAVVHQALLPATEAGARA